MKIKGYELSRNSNKDEVLEIISCEMTTIAERQAGLEMEDREFWAAEDVVNKVQGIVNDETYCAIQDTIESRWQEAKDPRYIR